MIIGKIVSSNSHLDYVARVVDTLDVAEPPPADEYGFARFVSIGAGDGTDLIGVIYDTKLVNPEYSNFGPRLSPKPDLAYFSPDFLDEQGILIGILIVGSREPDGGFRQGVPRRAVAAGQEAVGMSAAEVREFHRGGNGDYRLHYFSTVIAHARALAIPLIEAVIDQLESGASAEELDRLKVLRRSLLWQRTLGGLRL